jgi:hypothetical protein
MAVDKKISQLASGAPAQAGDEYVVARSGANYKLTLTNIAASMPATTITTGNLTFSSTAQRITGDMNNATVANRVMFQNSVTNGNTNVAAIPNGTATVGVFRGYGASDPTNATAISIAQIGTTDSRISAEINGTASYTPMTFYTGGSERVRIDTSGNVGIGTASPDARLDVDAGATALAARLQGTNSPYLSVLDNDNTVEALVAADGSASATVFGSITNHAVQFRTNNSERMRIDTSGNVGIGGTATAFIKCQIKGTLPTSSNLSIGFSQDATIPSGTTALYAGFNSAAGTQAASFTLTSYAHYRASQGTFGAGSAVTNQFCYLADSTITGATNNFGFYSDIASGSNRWNFYAAGTADNYFAGNTGVGVVPAADTRLRVRGSDATSSNYAIVLQNSTPASLFYVRNDGLTFTGLAALSPYNTTTANAANVEIANDGIMRRSTSSLRYKSDVVNATHGLADVLKLRSVTYKGKNDGDRIFGGLIAEEVHEAGLTEFVAYDKEGRPDAIHYGNMVALLVKAVQELTARVAELEAK